MSRHVKNLNHGSCGPGANFKWLTIQLNSFFVFHFFFPGAEVYNNSLMSTGISTVVPHCSELLKTVMAPTPMFPGTTYTKPH